MVLSHVLLPEPNLGFDYLGADGTDISGEGAALEIRIVT